MEDERANAKHVKHSSASSDQKAVIANPSRNELSLSESDRRQLAVWNATDQHYPQGRCVHELVAARAAAMPDPLALSTADATFTYGELNRRAKQLAHRLQTLGVARNGSVAACTERY